MIIQLLLAPFLGVWNPFITPMGN